MFNRDLHHDVARRGAGEDAQVVVIGLHGRDQGPEAIERGVVDHVRDPTVGWLLPSANAGSWYPHAFDAQSADNARAVSRSIDRLTDLVEVIPLESQRIVVMGFSQGACLACEFVARNPRRWGGLVAFTGGLMGPPDSDRAIDGDLRQTPVILTAGEHDPWIAADSVRSSGMAFERAGATVTTELIAGDAAHRIRPVEIDLLRQVIDAARSPRNGGIE